jgi:hypothetical protein
VKFPAYGSGNTLLFGGAVGAVVVYVLAAAIIAFVIGRPLIRLSYLNEFRARRSVDDGEVRCRASRDCGPSCPARCGYRLVDSRRCSCLNCPTSRSGTSAPLPHILSRKGAVDDREIQGALDELIGAELPGTLLVSVSHRSTVEQFHGRHLELVGDGEWRLDRLTTTG